MANPDLAKTYRKQIESMGDLGDERILEDIEEAHYFDGAIDHEQYIFLMRLYSEITGDHSVLP